MYQRTLTRKQRKKTVTERKIVKDNLLEKGSLNEQTKVENAENKGLKGRRVGGRGTRGMSSGYTLADEEN